MGPLAACRVKFRNNNHNLSPQTLSKAPCVPYGFPQCAPAKRGVKGQNAMAAYYRPSGMKKAGPKINRSLCTWPTALDGWVTSQRSGSGPAPSAQIRAIRRPIAKIIPRKRLSWNLPSPEIARALPEIEQAGLQRAKTSMTTASSAPWQSLAHVGFHS